MMDFVAFVYGKHFRVSCCSGTTTTHASRSSTRMKATHVDPLVQSKEIQSHSNWKGGSIYNDKGPLLTNPDVMK